MPYRFPKTPGFLSRQIDREAPGVIKCFQKIIVGAGERRGVGLLDDLVSNPWSMDRIKDYDTLRKYYLDAVENCIDGVTEIFMHPAYPIDDKPGEWMKRVYELRLLQSGDLLEAARRNNIELVSWSVFRDLGKI